MKGAINGTDIFIASAGNVESVNAGSWTPARAYLERTGCDRVGGAERPGAPPGQPQDLANSCGWAWPPGCPRLPETGPGGPRANHRMLPIPVAGRTSHPTPRPHLLLASGLDLPGRRPARRATQQLLGPI